MREVGNIVGHIPARGGSKRVPAKNLRYLGGKPMMAYAIECALQSGVLSEVYVNTDSETIAALATAYSVKVYRRPAALGSDTATGDDFTADFLKHIRPDVLVMVNPVCPLVTPEDIRSAVAAFAQSDCDTLITCQTTQMQTFCEGNAVNIDPNGPLAPSQQNPVVQILNWAVTIWDTKAFLDSYASRKSGYIGTKRLLFPLDPSHSLKISHEADFQEAELLLHARKMTAGTIARPQYWVPEEGIAAFAHDAPTGDRR
jgi:CMP-N-acetylneuraminic acid synthetase